MTPSSSQGELQRRLESVGFTLETLKPDDGIGVMFDFYQQVRADGCMFPPERDTLLYQWGIYDWGQGRFFELDLTRQFILSGDDPNDPDDDTMSQLRLTFYYQPTSVFEAMQSGNRWCQTPEDIPQFKSFVISTAAYEVTTSSKPHKVTLGHALV